MQTPSVPLPLSMDPQANCDITTSASDFQTEDSGEDPLSRFMQGGAKKTKTPTKMPPSKTDHTVAEPQNPTKTDYFSTGSTESNKDASFPLEYTASQNSEKTTPEQPSAQVHLVTPETKEETSGSNRSVSNLNRSSAEAVEPPPYKLIGEVFNSYIMVETDGKLLLIDKHAAHERILFEDMKKNLRGECTSQVLLMPLEISLSADEYATAEEYRTEIEAVGYGYSLSEKRKIAIVEQIPAILDNAAAEAMFVTVTGKLANGTGDVATTRDTFFEQALYQASCKAAIKAGRIYDASHLKWICDRVLSNPEIRFCPHGRPVAFEMTQNDIERSFKRT